MIDTYAYRFALARAIERARSRFFLRRSAKLPVRCGCGSYTSTFR